MHKLKRYKEIDNMQCHKERKITYVYNTKYQHKDGLQICINQGKGKRSNHYSFTKATFY